MKNVKILGTGCPKCNELEKRVKNVAEENDISIDLEKVTKINEILKYDVMVTPGLVIDGEVKSAGKLPADEDILSWLE
ncbi:thioredoxin family protein [candidate division KSB1 bacterium]|nr:thioredoxin family protein [candidate division KSB1 bacterium]